ncbi:prolipoprotein diacylglyceryl transferase [Motilibacter peucedani]|uniref:Phosphatidylglycerol--prolipoprotein diacylglyceryl transferase n=1 Tax=Motilibacter peucedani TaxID=598650 RepID=A0A420XVC9_9ACTN|nr:prolipoprotein diacylglyceryl transferase [Motilibacter peucedani]RKS84245.1 prolipoprotein diacylglyceryl transferase [Motilibacter peucedani]
MNSYAFLPSPGRGVWHLGPLPLRAYALCIIAGVILSVWVGERRWQARGGREGTVSDVAVWAVPFGVVGGRLYHVITTPEPYFGKGGHPLDAVKVWQGGLGIWGAISLGAVGAWIGCRRRGIALPPFADALAPGIVLAQALGRWGNYFNQELYGSPTTRWWGLEIDPAHRPEDTPQLGTYHPTFLYECIWDLGVAGLVVWADRKWRLGHGRAFALYVAAYCVGRSWIEAMRVDTAEHFLGLRLNQFTAAVLFLLATAYIVVSARLRPGREVDVEPGAAAPSADVDDDATPAHDPVVDHPADGDDPVDVRAAHGGSHRLPPSDQTPA